MKVLAEALSISNRRAIAATCVAILATTTRLAQADIDVWTTHGPPSGDVSVLAIDSTMPRILYAGTFSGSVFKSIDAGMTWDAAGLIPDPHSGISALAVDPATPSTLYAATGGYFGDGRQADIGEIVFKSTDAGATWAATAPATTTVSGSAQSAGDFVAVVALAIDPSAPDTIYAATSYRGVVKSTDAGATWDATGLIDTFAFALVIDPGSPSTLYASTDGGIFKSTDAGASWSATGFTRGFDSPSALVIDPGTPSTLYAGTVGDPNGVFKSTDAGISWGEANAGLTNTEVRALAIDPSEATRLYAGTNGGGVFKSTDAGATWRATNTGLTNFFVTALIVDPVTPGRVYAGTNGGGVFSMQRVAGCPGDCDGDGTVAVDELVRGVNIALDMRSLDACPSFDTGDDGRVTISELIVAVNNTMDGCADVVFVGDDDFGDDDDD